MFIYKAIKMFNSVIYQKFIVDFLKNNNYRVLLYILLVIIIYPLEIYAISKVKTNIFTSFFENNNKDKNIWKHPTFRYICLMLFIYFLIFLFGSLIYDVETKLFSDHTSFVRNKIFEKTIHTFSDSYEDMKVGKYLSQCMKLQVELKFLIKNIIREIFIKSLILIFISAIIFTVKPIFGLILFGYLIFTIIIFYWKGSEIVKLSTKRYIMFFEMKEKTSDSLSNLANIYINNENQKEIDSQEELSKEYDKINKKVYSMCGNLSLINKFVCLLVIFALFYFMYKDYLKGNISKNNFIFVIVLISIFIVSLFQLSDTGSESMIQLGLINSCDSFIKKLYINEKDLDDTSKINDIINGKIEFKDVSYSYGKGDNQKFLFKNISFTIPSNKVTAIVGSSGSGKTTLCKMVLKLHQPNNGQILIDDIDYNEIDTTLLRKRIIYVNQRTNLFNKTIMENIQYGNDDLEEKEIIKFIHDYNLERVFKDIHHGIYAECGVNGGNLSLGMQKVVILLRGILKPGYKIIIFDEPLAGLDNYHRGVVIDLIKQISNRKTVLIITHEKEILLICDNILDIREIKTGVPMKK